MKLVPIFVPDDSEDGLWSIHLDGKPQNLRSNGIAYPEDLNTYEDD